MCGNAYYRFNFNCFINKSLLFVFPLIVLNLLVIIISNMGKKAMYNKYNENELKNKILFIAKIKII